MSDNKSDGFFADEPTFVGRPEATLPVGDRRATAQPASDVVQLLAALPARERDALRMRNVERRPIARIAAELHVTEVEVAHLLLAGAKQLLASLKSSNQV